MALWVLQQLMVPDLHQEPMPRLPEANVSLLPHRREESQPLLHVPVRWSPWGAAGAAILTGTQLLAWPAIQVLGAAVGPGVWCGIGMITAFLWGVIVFGGGLGDAASARAKQAQLDGRDAAPRRRRLAAARKRNRWSHVTPRGR